MRLTLLAVVPALACGGPSHQVDPEQHGYAEWMLASEGHQRSADQHERAAADAEQSRSPDTYSCGDPVLNDQLTSGGTRVTTWQPCFDVAEERAMDLRETAAHERDLARSERAAASSLVHAELVACGGLPARERDHSVFAHKSEIADVIPHREAGQIRGVWIVFKPVAGLTPDWVRRDISCQHARWAVLGQPAAMAANDPTLVPGAQAQVFDRHDHLEVLVTTDSTDAGEMALARAKLDAPQHIQTAVR